MIRKLTDLKPTSNVNGAKSASINIFLPVSQPNTGETIKKSFEARYHGHADLWISASSLLRDRQTKSMTAIYEEFCQHGDGGAELRYGDGDQLQRFTEVCWKDWSTTVRMSLESFGSADGAGWKTFTDVSCAYKFPVFSKNKLKLKKNQDLAELEQIEGEFIFDLKETQLTGVADKSDISGISGKQITIVLEGEYDSSRVTTEGGAVIVKDRSGNRHMLTLQNDKELLGPEKEAQVKALSEAIKRNIEVNTENESRWLSFQSFADWTGSHEGRILVVI